MVGCHVSGLLMLRDFRSDQGNMEKVGEYVLAVMTRMREMDCRAVRCAAVVLELELRGVFRASRFRF